MTILSASEHFARLKELLELEAEAEKDEFLAKLAENGDQAAAAERSGTCLRALEVEDSFGGLGGRFVLELRKKGRAPLPWTKLDTGSPIVLREESKGAEAVRGVVGQLTTHTVQLVFEDELPEADGLLRIDLSYQDASRKREREALSRASSASDSRLQSLRAVLLGAESPRFDQTSVVENFFNQGLNEVQKAAVRLAMAAKDLAIVHGPPGTGKTTCLVEIVQQARRRGEKVLVCAPSNLGVDNLLEKLVERGEKPLRIGHPARVMEHLRPHTLDLQLEKHPATKLARQMMREAAQLFRQAGRYTRAAPEKGSKQAAYREARSLLADARKQEGQAISKILDQAPIVCATNTGLDASLIGSRRFDLLIIDEAAQSTEPSSWIPLLRAGRVVLGGDHCQLPATVRSTAAMERGYQISLMERLVELYGDSVTKMLQLQYRMHETIMAFSSMTFYEGNLAAAAEVAQHKLSDLGATVSLERPLYFIDTAGAGFQEESATDGGSRFNEKEAVLLLAQIADLMQGGVRAEHIGVISPYAAQVRFLKDRLAESGIEVDTIDGFQGREKEVILLSLVRSNDDQEIGFLKELRRLNVALTRAKRLLFVVGDGATLGVHPFYQSFIAFCEARAAYETIWEFAPEQVHL